MRWQSSEKPLPRSILSKNWIDFNAGVLAENAGFEEMGQQLFDYVLAVASGKKGCSEQAGFHDMAIFKQGVTL